MAYQKRRSATLEKAQARLNGLRSVHAEMDLGNGLTLRDYAALIATSDTRLQAQNLALSEADRTRIEFAETEAALSTLSSRILSAVAAMYGKDSKEYEMAGGKPPSTYKRSKKQAATTSSTTPQNGDTASTNGAAMNGAQAATSVH
ncbi:MAG: hypothetical protein KME27_21440 [Lyngbya sp. HA4199-MV5]|jgi:hypothetical protein|nr:hypothetical protein [Lyngbya sp. HA4199-MV5]